MQPGHEEFPPPWTCKPNTIRGRTDRAGQIVLFLLTAMFSLERWGWGCKWESGKFEDRRGKRLAMLPGLRTTWVFIESPMVLETGNPVSSELAGFRFLGLFILTLRSHTAQSLELLLLSVELVAQPAICGSRNNTGDFPGGLAVGIHSFSPEMIDLIVGFGTTRVVFISLVDTAKQNGRCPVGTAPIGYCDYSISLLVLVSDRCRL